MIRRLRYRGTHRPGAARPPLAVDPWAAYGIILSRYEAVRWPLR